MKKGTVTPLIAVIFASLLNISTAQETTIESLARCEGPESATLVTTYRTGEIRYVEVRMPWIIWYETLENLSMKDHCGAPYNNIYLFRAEIKDGQCFVEELKKRDSTNRKVPFRIKGKPNSRSYFNAHLTSTGTVVETELNVTNNYPLRNTTDSFKPAGNPASIDKYALSNLVSRATDDWHYPFIVSDPESGTQLLISVIDGQIWKLDKKKATTEKQTAGHKK